MNRGFFTGFKFGITVVIFLLGLLVNCNKKEPIPSYIHMDKIGLTTVYADQGSASHKITDAWIYIDDHFAGVYEMPFTVPVLFEGSHVLTVLPGIKENGISETRIPYVFYNKCEQTITLTPGKITTYNPQTTYSQSTNFSWIVNFEASATGICNNSGSPDTIMRIVTSPGEVFELTGSGKVELTAAQTSYFGVSCNKYALPQAGAPVFLELNYNCNTDFSVGVIGYSGSSIEFQSISLTLRPTNGWNKVYINLAGAVGNAGTSTKFGIFFSMLKNENLPTSYLYLDNIKLIN